MSREYFDRLYEEQPYIPKEYLEKEKQATMKEAFDALEINMLKELLDMKYGIPMGINKERNKIIRHILANLTQARYLSRYQIWDRLVNNCLYFGKMLIVENIVYGLPPLPPLPPSTQSEVRSIDLLKSLTKLK